MQCGDCPIKTRAYIQLQPFTVKHISLDLISERSADGRLNIFVVDMLTARVLQVLETQIKALFSRWLEDIPCLLLVETHKAPPFSLFVEAQAQTIALLKQYPGITCQIAFVIPEDSENIAVVHTEENYWFETFTSREQALQWLLQDSP